MANPVANGAAAERHPAAPIPRHPERRVRLEGRRAEPQIIVEALGHVVMLIQFGQVWDLAIHIFESIAAGMHGVDLPDGARPDPFAQAADSITGVPLIAELRDHLVFVGGRHKLADFMDRVGQRFFAIDMLAAPHGRHGDDGMGVIRRADDHAVNLLAQLVEHHAIVREAFGVRIFGEFLGGVVFIHVAQRDDVVAQSRHLIHVGPTPAADADAGDVELLVRGKAFRTAQQPAGKKVEQGHAYTGAIEKLSAVDRTGFVFVHNAIGSVVPLVDEFIFGCRLQSSSLP